MRPVVLAGALVLALSGCGSDPVVVTGGPEPHAYDGPMHVKLDHSDDATVAASSGAAGKALECTGDPYAGGGADYDSGLATVQDSAKDALSNLFDKDFGWVAPTTGYRVERSEGDRVLFSYDVDGLTKAAFIVESFRGAEHCDWQDITFLRLGEDPRGVARDRVEEYVRDTTAELGRVLNGAFSDHAQLPDGASNTGWRHDGRELWLVPDKSAAFLVSLDDKTDVERWPASTQPIGCD
jgi:hypothetical protein